MSASSKAAIARVRRKGVALARETFRDDVTAERLEEITLQLAELAAEEDRLFGLPPLSTTAQEERPC